MGKGCLKYKVLSLQNAMNSEVVYINALIDVIANETEINSTEIILRDIQKRMERIQTRINSLNIKDIP